MRRNAERKNAARPLRWLMAGSAVIFFVVMIVSLAQDHMPFERGRLVGYVALTAAIGGCCWAWGWLTRDSALNDDLPREGE